VIKHELRSGVKKTALDCGGWTPKRCNIVQVSQFPLVELWERIKTAKERGWTKEQVAEYLRSHGVFWDKTGIVYCQCSPLRLIARFSCGPQDTPSYLESMKWAGRPVHCSGFAARYILLHGGISMECSKCGEIFPAPCENCGKASLRPVKFKNSVGHDHIKAVCTCGRVNGEVANGRRKNTKNPETSCRTCGSAEDLEKDHIVPLAKGGADIVDNTQMLCGPCHDKKTVADFPHWKPYPGWKPRGRGPPPHQSPATSAELAAL